MMWRHRYPDYKGNHHALYKYNTFAKEIIQQFKFMGDCDIANLFSQEIKSCFKKRKASDLIVPIPLSPDSYAVRGFNQTELLLEAADLPMSLLLENRYQTEKQSKKNREERLNSLQPFVIKEEYKRDIKGNNIILADDIYTTGRTMYHAIELINKYDPASVTTFSVFR
ncbi:MAG: ComF family protein [Alkalibacterium sp.]|nr:ComF family protein [Alkalibacterium sp.]